VNCAPCTFVPQCSQLDHTLPLQMVSVSACSDPSGSGCSGSKSFDSHAPTYNYTQSVYANGEQPRVDDVFAGNSATTRRVSAGEFPPRRASAGQEPGVRQWPRTLHLYRRARGRRTTKEDYLASPPELPEPPNASALTHMASILQQQQRVLDDLTTSVQDLRVDVRKTQTVQPHATNALGGSATAGSATAGARHNLESGSVDSIEDLGRLLAENADLDRLVTKVHVHVQSVFGWYAVHTWYAVYTC